MFEFTIIATSYNDEKNIAAYIESLKEFEVQPTELLIVDGGSKDNTESEILKYQSSVKFKITTVFDGKRRNISEGYNDAIRLCKTEWILITGIGNCYAPNYTKELVKALQEHPVDMVYGPFIGNNVNKFSTIYNKAFLHGNKAFDYGQAFNRGVLINKSVFAKCGYFYDQFIYAGEDTEFYSRVKKFGVTSYYASDAVVFWDPPLSLKEAMKKTKFNAIADLQLFDLKKLISKDLIVYGFLAFFIVSLIISWPLALGEALLLMLYGGYKIESFDMRAIVLWIFNFYYTGYQHFLQRKYATKEYRFDLMKMK